MATCPDGETATDAPSPASPVPSVGASTTSLFHVPDEFEA